MEEDQNNNPRKKAICTVNIFIYKKVDSIFAPVDDIKNLDVQLVQSNEELLSIAYNQQQQKKLLEIQK